MHRRVNEPLKWKCKLSWSSNTSVVGFARGERESYPILLLIVQFQNVDCCLQTFTGRRWKEEVAVLFFPVKAKYIQNETWIILDTFAGCLQGRRCVSR